MKRLTKDDPKSSFEIIMNYVYTKKDNIMLHYGEGEKDTELCEYIAMNAKEKGCEVSADEVSVGACWECDCLLSVFNTVATQAVELRERLKEIEDILGDEYDLDRLPKIVAADRKIKEAKSGKKQDNNCFYVFSVVDKAIGKYGAEAQLNVLFEEMAELQNAICKYKRGRATVEEIAEELADVNIMLIQAIKIFDCADLTSKYFDEKIDKLSEKLNIDE